MTRAESIRTLINYASAALATYEDRGYDYSACQSCDWNTKTHGWGVPHPETCELTQAIRMMELVLQEEGGTCVD